MGESQNFTAAKPAGEHVGQNVNRPCRRECIWSPGSTGGLGTGLGWQEVLMRWGLWDLGEVNQDGSFVSVA